MTSRHGSPSDTLGKAFEALQRGPVGLVARSRVFLTPFMPAGGGPDVLNAAVLVRTPLSPQALLDHLHGIEAAFDRARGQRWAGRTLDLDLLAIGDLILPDRATLRRWIAADAETQRSQAPGHLILPHPRLQDRAFVLVPAADIAPDWRHPLTGKTIREMLAALPAEDIAAVKPVDD